MSPTSYVIDDLIAIVASGQADYDELLKRILVACESMKAGGWWEAPRVDVKKAVGKEFVSAIFKQLIGLS